MSREIGEWCFNHDDVGNALLKFARELEEEADTLTKRASFIRDSVKRSRILNDDLRHVLGWNRAIDSE